MEDQKTWRLFLGPPGNTLLKKRRMPMLLAQLQHAAERNVSNKGMEKNGIKAQLCLNLPYTAIKILKHVKAFKYLNNKGKLKHSTFKKCIA